MQRLVAVPVVVARRDEALEREPRRLDPADGLAQRDEALVVDAARQRPLAPVRLADDDVAARAHRRRQRSKRSRQVVPDERRAEAQRGIPGAVGSSGNACASASTISTRSPTPAAATRSRAASTNSGARSMPQHGAAERRREQDGRAALAAREIEHARVRVEPEIVPEQRDLLGARRVLNLVVALGDGVVPGHRGSLLPRRRATACETRLRAGRTRRACSSSDASARASFATFRASLRR